MQEQDVTLQKYKEQIASLELQADAAREYAEDVESRINDALGTLSQAQNEYERLRDKVLPLQDALIKSKDDQDKLALAVWAMGVELSKVGKERDTALEKMQAIAEAERDKDGTTDAEEVAEVARAMRDEVAAVQKMKNEVGNLTCRRLSSLEDVEAGVAKSKGMETDALHHAKNWMVIKDVINVAVGVVASGTGTTLLMMYGPVLLINQGTVGVPDTTGLALTAGGSLIPLNRGCLKEAKTTISGGILDLLMRRSGGIRQARLARMGPMMGLLDLRV